MYVSNITGKSYTGPDFLRMLEKRVRKHVRLNELVSSGGTYTFEQESKAGNYLARVLEEIFEKRICFAESGILLSTETLDEWSAKRVESIFTGDPILTTELPTPLQVVSSEEVCIACELLHIEGSAPKHNHEFVEKLHALYPQTKSSFLRSFLFIEELEKASKN